MSRKSFSLSKVYGLLEPGPVVLLTTAGKTKANIVVYDDGVRAADCRLRD